MDQPRNNFQYFLHWLSTTVGMVAVALLLVALVAAGILAYAAYGTRLSIGHRNSLSLSPTQIQSIRDIGEWEFLAITDEELIDTVRYGFFGDNHLARIYYGTLRLGIDLSETAPDWIRPYGDSLVVTLPPVRLLDDEFIDETRTRSFYESGSWSHDDRQRLYDRAVAAMRSRCLNASNIQTAEQNARQQLQKLFHALGFPKVGIIVSREKAGDDK